MGSDSRRNPVSSRGRYFPVDLVAVLVVTLLTLVIVLLPVVRETPFRIVLESPFPLHIVLGSFSLLRIVLGFPFLFFVPGYALVAVLFPEAGDDRDDDGITGIERIGLSFAASLIVVPTVGIVLNFTPIGIQVVPVIVSLSLVVVALVAVAFWRRLALPVEERFDDAWSDRLAGLRSELFAPGSWTHAVLNVVLVASILVAAFSVGYAVVVPTEGQSYTELYLLTENGGELVAEDYPTEFTVGEPRSLVVGIGNREHEPVSYTVLVEVHRVRVGTDSMRVLETRQLHRFQPRLAPNETWQRRHTIELTTVGRPLRLTYLLYRGPVPSEPTTDNAYRELHLWVNVTDG